MYISVICSVVQLYYIDGHVVVMIMPQSLIVDIETTINYIVYLIIHFTTFVEEYLLPLSFWVYW